MTTTMTSTHPHAAMMAHFRAVAAFVALAVAAYLLGGGSAGLDVWMPVERPHQARWRSANGTACKQGRCRREWRRRLSSPSHGGGGWRDARVRRRPLSHDLRRAEVSPSPSTATPVATCGSRPQDCGAEEPIPCHPWAWQGQANVARDQLGSGVVEQRDLHRRRAGVGLRFELARGHRRSPHRRPGHRRCDSTEHRRHRGQGPHRRRTLAGPRRVGRTAVSLTVPASVLRRAAYPLTIDPTISPEHPVSDPVLSRALGDRPAGRWPSTAPTTWSSGATATLW